MQFRHTVHAETRMDCQPGHMNLAVLDDRITALQLIIIGELSSDFAHKPPVDFLNDLINTRKQSLEDINRPFFQCLCKNRMIGVCKHLGYYAPCHIPAGTILINKNTHKLRNRYNRMSVIKLNDMQLRELGKIIAVARYKFSHQILQAGRREEILLLQTQGFSARTIIIRIQYTADVFGIDLTFHRAVILHVVEQLQVKAVGGFGFPQAQRIHRIGVIAYDRHIIGNSRHFFGVLQIKAVMSVRCLSVHDVAAETYGHRLIAALNFPRVTVTQPAVRILHLITVDNALLEHTVFIPDAVAVSRIVKRGKTVKETGCKPAEAAVAKTGIRLLILKQVIVQVHVAQNFLHFFLYARIDHIVAQRTSHKKFCGKIVYLTHRTFFILMPGSHPFFHDDGHNRRGHRIIQIVLACMHDIFTVLLAQTPG